MTTTSPGLATATELQNLHGELSRELSRQLRQEPSTGILAVARAFLRDQGLLGLAHDEADRKRLERMYRMYVGQLLRALEAPSILSSTMLAEIRAFLASQGVNKDLAEGVTRAQALRALGDATALPFKAPKGIQ